MPRQASVAVENSFIKGLVTESTGLNFPENACTETFNCVFEPDGSVERRLGFGFEANSVNNAASVENVVLTSYVWKNVNGDGGLSLVVGQIGNLITFARTDGVSLSAGLLGGSVDLLDYLAAGAPDPGTVEAQFSHSSDTLIITHPYCQPIRVTYDPATDTITDVGFNLFIRDFEGDVADTLATRERPTSTLAALGVAHRYNLYNQGWRDTELSAWDGARTDMPSNADVWWTYKVPTVSGSSTLDQFSTAEIANWEPGNSPAPRGHFILTVWDKDRDQATLDADNAGEDITFQTGLTATDTSYFRPSTSAFFAGRVFYSGLNYRGYSSDIYFTQIIEREEQYGRCHQEQDPTSETLHDLLATDGGVIKIPEAGAIVKLFSMSGALIAFATNGIWAITGNSGLGFIANDYTVQKISSINAFTASSFVDVAGYPAWWNQEGIYVLTPAPLTQGNPSAPGIKSLTFNTIKTFYDEIPLSSKFTARGAFDPTAGVIQWVYRSFPTGSLSDLYSFDRVLNYNILTNAWYPWSIPAALEAGNFRLHSVVLLDHNKTFFGIDDVRAGALNVDNVQDGLGNEVVRYRGASSEAIIPKFKYFVSLYSGGTQYVSVAETNNDAYEDFTIDYESYFITGYKIRGSAIMKSQPTWVNIYSDTSQNLSVFNFRGVWDYALLESTNRFSSEALVIHSNDNYAAKTKRLKVRGHGKALQFKVRSESGYPFQIIGWTTFDTRNPLP